MRTYTAELVGTFALVFVGAGAAALGAVGVVGVALAHGLILMVLVYAFGSLSGAHVNPAVTLGLWLRSEIELRDALGYWAAQLVGGAVAGFALLFIFGGPINDLGATVLANGVSPLQGLVLEAILTFFLVTSVLRSAVRGEAGDAVGAAVGLTLAASILVGGPVTGASLNPARTFGPAVATGQFTDIWVYFVGPLLGGAAAAALDRWLGE